MAYQIEHREVSETLKGAIVGMLLGDACIIPHYKSPSKQCYFQFKHSLKQKTYALYKAELLRQVTRVRVTEYEHLDKRTNRVYASIQAVTLCHPFYTRLREAWYRQGRKTVDPFWLDYLDERGFALWFFDDGHTTLNGPSNIAVCSFSEPEIDLLAHTLWTRFGLHTSKRCAIGARILYIPAKSKARLRELLLPYAHVTAMLYKLPNEKLPSNRDGDIVCSL